MKNKKTKIMIVDDFALIRAGLKNLLELDGSMKVISEAQDGTDCLNKLNEKLPDILLLDIICRTKTDWKYYRKSAAMKYL